jgi:drug/metabolite transporter (DMT)-like permease
VSIFSISTFLVAGITGLLLVAGQTIQGKGRWEGKSILGGIVLGIPNYFSLYFMIKMLEHPTWKSATIFTVHNVCIVAFTTLLGLLLFKEKLNKANIIGLVLAMISLILVTQ